MGACSAKEFSRPPTQLAGSLLFPGRARKRLRALPTLHLLLKLFIIVLYCRSTTHGVTTVHLTYTSDSRATNKEKLTLCQRRLPSRLDAPPFQLPSSIFYRSSASSTCPNRRITMSTHVGPHARTQEIAIVPGQRLRCEAGRARRGTSGGARGFCGGRREEHSTGALWACE